MASIREGAEVAGELATHCRCKIAVSISTDVPRCPMFPRLGPNAATGAPLTRRGALFLDLVWIARFKGPEQRHRECGPLRKLIEKIATANKARDAPHITLPL